MQQMARRPHLYFHAPCFDGTVSAVLTLDFLKNSQGWHHVILEPANYDLRTSWLALPLRQPCAVVDFLYHPQADFWADHHLTTFLTEEARRDFEAKSGKWHRYNRRAGSCAGLLWKHLRRMFGYRNARYEPLVAWAEKIDAARYESVEEAIQCSAPALQINVSLAGDNAKKWAVRLVSLLRTWTLEEVAGLPEVQARVAKIMQLDHLGRGRFAHSYRVEDGIVVFDVDARGVKLNRYLPYHFCPGALYSAGIERRKDGAKITTMRNPWREFPSVFLGKLCERFGGGGHRRVGAIMLSQAAAPNATRILEQLVGAIRMRHNRMKGGASR